MQQVSILLALPVSNLGLDPTNTCTLVMQRSNGCKSGMYMYMNLAFIFRHLISLMAFNLLATVLEDAISLQHLNESYTSIL